MRLLSGSAALFLLLGAQSPALGQAIPIDPAGRYEFNSVTLEGDPFTGTIHISGSSGAYGGRLPTPRSRAARKTSWRGSSRRDQLKN